jgi:hypothetical protein
MTNKHFEFKPSVAFGQALAANSCPKIKKSLTITVATPESILEDHPLKK